MQNQLKVLNSRLAMMLNQNGRGSVGCRGVIAMMRTTKGFQGWASDGTVA